MRIAENAGDLHASPIIMGAEAKETNMLDGSRTTKSVNLNFE
jgi:hypothetical protein